MFLSGTQTQTTIDEYESNIIAEEPEKAPVTSSKPIQALGATGVAGALSTAAQSAAPLAEYSDYLRILWVLLSVAAIGYFLYSHRKENE